MDREGLVNKYYELIKGCYDIGNVYVKAKYQHSLEVAYLMSKYANILGSDSNLAFVIGLLHDIGRFHQISFYKTFDDSKSMDHGDYGVKILDRCNLYEYFDIIPLQENIVREAILNHN